MSEKELRRLLMDVEEGCYISVVRPHIIKALAEDPDVVKVLRWARAEQSEDGVLDSYAAAVGFLIEHIQEEFHVRLADNGGWKWTE